MSALLQGTLGECQYLLAMKQSLDRDFEGVYDGD